VPAVRLTIPLSDATGDALRRLASQEYRDTRMQAKFLLEQAIHDRAGALPADDRLTEAGSPATREPA
jgi:hypothetical protein